jgi:hypothetical protein
MFIFIISVITVFIISFCFLKNKFWENRYLVLLICGCVALVATLITNFIVRGKFETKTEVILKKAIYTFYLPDSLFNDSAKSPIIKNWDYYSDYDAEDFFKNDKDTIHKQIPVNLIFYTVKKHMYIGNLMKKYVQWHWNYDFIYIAPSNSDSVAYLAKKKLIYDIPPNNWITGFSLPRISTINVLYVPPKEYATIPDSLIRKLPF